MPRRYQQLASSVNTIHSSSLAYYPVAYNKPETSRAGNNNQSAVDATSENPGKPRNNFSLQPSNSEQIRAILEETGLKADNNNSQPGDIRTQKALNAYTQNLNQPTQVRVAQMISGIDLYA